MDRQEGTSYQTSAAGSTDSAKQTTQEVTDKLGQTADTVQQQATNVANQQFTAQTKQATKGLESVSSALNQAADQMRKQGQDTMATFADEAANQIDQLSGYLRQEDLHDMIDGVERFARRQPFVFLGGAFAVGMIAARFLKASRPDNANWGRSSDAGMYQYQNPWGRQYGPQNYPGAHYAGRQPFAGGFAGSGGNQNYGYPYSGQSGTGSQYGSSYGTGSGTGYGTSGGYGRGTGYGTGDTGASRTVEVDTFVFGTTEPSTPTSGENLGSSGDAMGKYPNVTSTEGGAYRDQPGEGNKGSRYATE